MAITERQRKIINPYAESVNTNTRLGVGYNYEEEANKFVIDAIQEKYLYFFDFPKVGESLKGLDREITRQDMLAYFALYPQNGKVVGDEVIKLSDTEALSELQDLVDSLEGQGVLEKYSSKTSELTFQEDYRGRQGLANLISIPAAHSKQYKNQLREAFGLPEVQYSDDVGLDLLNLNPDITTYISSDSNVDLYDWRKNGLPGEDNDRVYFNPVDSNYYYIKRTTNSETSAYAFNELRSHSQQNYQAAVEIWNRYTEDQRNRYSAAVENSIQEILKLTGRHSEQNVARLQEKYNAPASFSLLSYRDLRPGSRWVYALQISTIDINNLPESTDRTSKPSYEEYEISTLQKAKRIIGIENQSTMSVDFRVEDMLRYMFSVRSLLSEYNARLLDEGLTPSVLNGINLEREVDRLETFFDLLSIFYGYNKISLEDDDRVQLYLTKDYLLDHICVNGSFYYQGCGNKTYLNIAQEQARIANAFSLYTPTTFSLIKNSYEIYIYAKNTAILTLESPLDFLSKYVYPPTGLDAAAVKRMNAASNDDQKRKKKRKTLFTQLSELSNKTSPAEYEKLFSNKPLSYRMSSTLSGIDCNTGQAKAAKYALRFWQAATGKTKIRSLIRETIILLRQEIIEDEATKRQITDAANYAQNPAAAMKQIERAVNQQISCSLDVLGDFIEDSFLDPIGAPPVANSLVRKTLDAPIKIEFTKKKMISLKTKQSKVYRKAIETILLNFLKSIVAGIAKDIVGALLGCGPKGNKNPSSGLKNSFKSQDYGFTDLNSFLDDVDLIIIARAANLFNVDQQGLKTDPTLPQLNALIGDVSLMSTPVELQQLLDGDASNELEEHLLETVSGNETISFISPYANDRSPNGRMIINPSIYGTIDFSDNKLIDFFMVLGRAIENAGNFGDLPFRSPLEAYCDQRDSYTNPLTLNFDIPEIEAQYSDIVNSKINKINNLCNWLRDLTNIKFELERLINSLPTMTWYDDLLRFIALLSNDFTEWLAGLFSDLFGKEQITRQQPAYNLYNSKMGTELFYQIFFSLRELPINQLFFTGDHDYFLTPAGWNNSRVGFSTSIEDNFLYEDTLEFNGNFGARTNSYTEANVYNFIWEDSRTNSSPSPGRLNIPQYRNPIEEPYDSFDSAYYSLRNSPKPLLDILGTRYNELLNSHTVDLLTDGKMRQIRYGDTRDIDEKQYLARISRRVYEYMLREENESPYISWTGASLLRCSNQPNGDIRILFRKPDLSSPVVSYYNPASLIHNEVSLSQSVIGRNGEYTSVDYRIFSNLETDNHSISMSDNYILNVDGVDLPGHRPERMRTLYSNFSIGLPYEFPNAGQNNVGSADRDFDTVSIQNYRVRIDTSINNSVINDIGRRRMPRYISAVNKLPLKKSEDICIDQEDIFRAESGIQVIQTRLMSFFINVMPLASVYPNWGSIGTTKLITDYLYRKILAELSSREILGAFFGSTSYIKLVYPNISDDEEFENNPIILDGLSPKQNMKNIIEATYLGMLSNIQRISEYSELRESVFGQNTITFPRYKNTLLKFYKILGDANTDLESYGIAFNNVQITREKIREFYNENGLTELGMLAGAYYFPIAFQIASYLIYYDAGIKYSARYSDTNYKILVETAASDDNLLTAIKGQLVQKFSTKFIGFPVTVATFTGQREIIYYNSDQAVIRADDIDVLIARQRNRMGSFRSLEDLLNTNTTSQAEFLNIFSEEYQNIISDIQSPEDVVIIERRPERTDDGRYVPDGRSVGSLKSDLNISDEDWDDLQPLLQMVLTQEIFYLRDQLRDAIETTENNIMPHLARLGRIDPSEYQSFTEAKIDFRSSNFYGITPGAFTQVAYFQKISDLLKSYFYTTVRPSNSLIPEEYVSTEIGLNNLTRPIGDGSSWVEGGPRSVFVDGLLGQQRRVFELIPENKREGQNFLRGYALIDGLGGPKRRQIMATISVLAMKFYYEYVTEQYSPVNFSNFEKMLEEKSILEKLVITNE
mgnify:FL=1